MELVDVLDDLSFRSSRATQLAALEHIQSLLAVVCVRPHDPLQRPRFLQQQNDFETNIVSRIISSGILSASTVSRIVDETRAKASTSSPVADITALALSALQGMALIHARSKTYLGRRLGIQTLLDLLTALRHASVNPDDPDTTVTSGIDSSDSKLAVLLSPLACSVIDTLLCLLVDSPLALRVFEECNGLEVIVRTLKKVIGQSVRMKCLEFLYFYLQDEDVLAVTGGPAINLPAGLAKLGSSLAQPTPKPARTSKPSASKPQVSSPTSGHALQTPRRPKTKPAPTTETRPRRLPLERTASGDSTHSALSTRSDATDALEPSRINGRDSEMRSVSRSSTYSAASTASHMTDSSRTKSREPEREPKRLFPRLSVMPSYRIRHPPFLPPPPTRLSTTTHIHQTNTSASVLTRLAGLDHQHPTVQSRNVLFLFPSRRIKQGGSICKRRRNLDEGLERKRRVSRFGCRRLRVPRREVIELLGRTHCYPTAGSSLC
ncbi:cell division control protein [Rhizoctonia solani AG-3 Rhs1AP]|uniref:Cell division control protein n=1 Tax=Rhizoctonia solani AG-3 Rhs1AP TaxID=1086054 RepID=X8JFA4_9AGAM|nr:cell division control protein [Rhizoctonia solani AG-3 Rhs1AP]